MVSPACRLDFSLLTSRYFLFLPATEIVPQGAPSWAFSKLNLDLESTSGGTQPVAALHSHFEFFCFVLVNFCRFLLKLFLGNFLSVSSDSLEQRLGLKETLLAVYLLFSLCTTRFPCAIQNLSLCLYIVSGARLDMHSSNLYKVSSFAERNISSRLLPFPFVLFISPHPFDSFK